MNSTCPLLTSIYLTILCCSFNCVANPQLINTHNNSTPIASKEETKIKHWRQPEIKREFWDIPLLPNAFIDVNPAANLDNIPVGTLGTDGGNKTDIMTLAKEIDQGDHGKFDSLLITYKGKLLFESYYLRGRIDLSHPQSSVTKVYTGLALGRAIKLGYLNLADLNKPVASFLEDLEPKKFVYGADEITLHQALTMTSGLRINEESRKVMKNNPQLVKGQKEIQFLFENSNPIIPESKVFYYDIGPQLIMQVLEAVIPGTVKIFIEKEVFGPLGITNFDWKTAPSGSPESIWKSSLTSRDMIKIGLLVSNKGKWQGNQLIDESFITKSINKLIITNCILIEK